MRIKYLKREKEINNIIYVLAMKIKFQEIYLYIYITMRKGNFIELHRKKRKYRKKKTSRKKIKKRGGKRRKSIRKKTRRGKKRLITRRRIKKSKKNKNHQLNKYTGGALCPQNNSAEDIYNLSYSYKCEGSQTWLLYKDETQDDVIIKKVGPAEWLTENTIKKEIDATTKAGNLGIGPEVVFSTICHEERGEKTYAVGYIVMKFIHGRTLKKKDLKDKCIVEQINALLKEMGANDMKHNDLHNGNIMIGYTTDDATPIDPTVLINERVWIIDHSGELNHDDSPLTHLNIEWNDDDD